LRNTDLVDSDVDQQGCNFSHTTGVCIIVSNINSKNRKEETRKKKQKAQFDQIKGKNTG
jgi:hypothetical protein